MPRLVVDLNLRSICERATHDVNFQAAHRLFRATTSSMNTPTAAQSLLVVESSNVV
jgi:hypothetical protein